MSAFSLLFARSQRYSYCLPCSLHPSVLNVLIHPAFVFACHDLPGSSILCLSENHFPANQFDPHENTMSFAEDRKGSTASAIRRKSVADNQVTSVLSANEVAIFDRELTADEETLAALGYKCEAYCNPWKTIMLMLYCQTRVQA